LELEIVLAAVIVAVSHVTALACVYQAVTQQLLLQLMVLVEMAQLATALMGTGLVEMDLMGTVLVETALMGTVPVETELMGMDLAETDLMGMALVETDLMATAPVETDLMAMALAEMDLMATALVEMVLEETNLVGEMDPAEMDLMATALVEMVLEETNLVGEMDPAEMVLEEINLVETGPVEIALEVTKVEVAGMKMMSVHHLLMTVHLEDITGDIMAVKRIGGATGKTQALIALLKNL